MDVVRTVLRVVVFDQECGSLNSIIMRLSRLYAARPCETDTARVTTEQAAPAVLSDFVTREEARAAKLERAVGAGDGFGVGDVEGSYVG